MNKTASERLSWESWPSGALGKSSRSRSPGGRSRLVSVSEDPRGAGVVGALHAYEAGPGGFCGRQNFILKVVGRH